MGLKITTIDRIPSSSGDKSKGKGVIASPPLPSSLKPLKARSVRFKSQVVEDPLVLEEIKIHDQ